MPSHDPTTPPRAADVTSLSLLQKARGNDPDAWRRLVHLYHPMVVYWAGRGGVLGPDADDVAQEVFQAAAGGLHGFRRDRPGDTFRGWLRAITRNVVLMHFRRLGRQPRAAGGSEALNRLQAVAAPDLDDDPPAELGKLYQRAVELVRGEFEERTWRAFWRTVVEGRATADIAAELGVTTGAVRMAKFRVLRRLQEEVGDLDVSPEGTTAVG